MNLFLTLVANVAVAWWALTSAYCVYANSGTYNRPYHPKLWVKVSGVLGICWLASQVFG